MASVGVLPVGRIGSPGGSANQKTMYDQTGRPVQVPSTYRAGTSGDYGTLYDAAPGAAPSPAGGPGSSYSSSQLGPGGSTVSTGQSMVTNNPTWTPGGSSTSGAPVTQPAYDQQQQTLLQARLAQDEFTRRLGMLSSGSGSAPTVSHGSVNGNEQAARDGAFAREKTRQGEIALGSIKALQDIMGARGLRGSSIEANAIAGELGTAGDAISRFATDQTMADVGREADIADMVFQGGLTQRGQDLAARQSLMGLISAGGLY